uniref:Uncharacterized protein n=1 Tax=Caenorhabditis japonica TaxID=281687 RepID=A0A8R1I405_CAEJA
MTVDLGERICSSLKRIAVLLSERQSLKRKASTDDSQAKKPKKACQYCGQDHPPIDCQQYKSLTQSWQKLATTRMCPHCLGEGHPAESCRFKQRSYQICSEPHHNSLCSSKVSDGKANSTAGTHMEQSH